ncbi:Restriction endonuclease [Alteromonas sp. 38]|uniref:restriction endonuclease n=1 Tax=unclassified Alteromonas TaxID=2614992 RepID=UPI0012F0DB50|nr:MULTISPECIES: restriction endonuclease [unclassified Alteromonas]CAD5288434.1 Restriction endonuclease [Alteromonas sp. 154]VXB25937.1 Restriction endonuclease [Alteromonas sp. 38]
MRSLFSDIGINISPTDFEILVQKWIENSGQKLTSFEAKHNVKLEAHDGTYQIDVLAVFEALGAEFKIVIECKKHKNAIPRSLVQILHDRVRSLGAQKGMLFATTGFQSGAIKYAKEHGIALIRITEGNACYETRSAYPVEPPAYLEFPDFMGWQIEAAENETISIRAIELEADDFFDIANKP